MALNNRSSVLAIKEETTAGTPVFPSATTSYIALQEDFTFQPNFELISNDEIRASIGVSKGITGKEQPAASFSHYLRHSGTEGTAPNFSSLLKSLFGATTANGTQRTTTTGSTTTVISLGAGGSDFARGFAVLIKDGTNGYSIRPVHSVSSNDLTLGFAVGTGPATGIGVGKCVNYSPANTGHPTITATLYRANGGAIEQIAGGRVTECSIDFSAGQLINATYSLDGTKFLFDPIEITSSTRYLDFEDDDGDHAAVVTAKTYRDPHELASALQAAMQAVQSSDPATVTYSNTTGKFTIASAATTFELKWNTGSNTANTIGTKLGFSVAADDTGAQTYTSDNAITISAPHTPAYDSADPLVAKDNQVLIGDATDSTCFSASNVQMTITNEVQDVDDICAESGVSGKVIQRRRAVVTVQGELAAYEAGKWQKYRSNSDLRFMYAFGTKSGGNWEAGKCGCLYIASGTITSFEVVNDNGIARLALEITAYVDSSSNGEVYLNFL